MFNGEKSAVSILENFKDLPNEILKKEITRLEEFINSDRRLVIRAMANNVIGEYKKVLDKREKKFKNE